MRFTWSFLSYLDTLYLCLFAVFCGFLLPRINIDLMWLNRKINISMHSRTVDTNPVSQKRDTELVVHNFTTCWPIFTVLSLAIYLFTYFSFFLNFFYFGFVRLPVAFWAALNICVSYYSSLKITLNFSIKSFRSATLGKSFTHRHTRHLSA